MISAGADDIIWRPNSAAQERFLACSARECIYAGEAGGGKTAALLAAPLRWVTRLPGYCALILRRTWPSVQRSILSEMFDLYPPLGGQVHEGGRFWTWKDGGSIRIATMERPEDRINFKGGGFEFIGYEELDTFEEVQYTYLFSRQRTSKRDESGAFYPLRMRATANPGGVGTPWIVKRWGPWIYKPPRVSRNERNEVVFTPDENTPPDFVGPFAKDGERLWAITDDTGKREFVPKGTTLRGAVALSSTYIQSRRRDNTALDHASYETGLRELDPISRAQLMEGNWFARGGKGAYFNRAWLKERSDGGFRDIATPVVKMRVRVWDLAATAESASNKDPDWTVGGKLSIDANREVGIEDIRRIRCGPGEVLAEVQATAELDALEGGTPATICLLHDPGQAGKYQIHDFVRALGQYHVIPIRVLADKVTMGKPFSAACFNRRVYVLRRPWVVDLFSELEAFPEGHDDQWDVCANGYRVLEGLVGGALSFSGGGAQKKAKGQTLGW